MLGCNNNETKKNDLIQTHNQPDSAEIYLSKYLSEADSIILVSRSGRTKEAVYADPTANGIPIVKNGQLNVELIKTKVNVVGNSLNTLIKILTRSCEDIGPLKCGGFNPHYSILILKNKQYSYIDLCFNCEEHGTSKDLYLLTFDNRKYQELLSFFIKEGSRPN